MTFGTGTIFFIDPRRFMTLTWERTFPELCGIEPLPDLEPAYLPARAKHRKGPIKTFLLDQSVIAGIGNIYACEILYTSGIAPNRPAKSLTPDEWRQLLSAVHAVLGKAIACRGTSISDWRDLNGSKGTYQHELRVYNRKGLPCLRCGGTIERISLSGRGTYFCPRCQI
jgi:formamidopyrimidine-DNA glycosylase